ncbi:LOW QUALITY PROTEIN: hypothetical protein MXB_332 [Myxobolus squamalis]|nr:LOW QUALITY PROTEIN: hypothetical protein MXB_332 [Myxobolus squamalis]
MEKTNILKLKYISLNSKLIFLSKIQKSVSDSKTGKNTSNRPEHNHSSEGLEFIIKITKIQLSMILKTNDCHKIYVFLKTKWKNQIGKK